MITRIAPDRYELQDINGAVYLELSQDALLERLRESGIGSSHVAALGIGETTARPKSHYVEVEGTYDAPPQKPNQYWFTKTPTRIMKEHLGIETSVERARDFENSIDGNPDMWYYLGSATDPRAGDEALKWVLGALAAEVKARKLDFSDIPKIISATMLRLFTLGLLDGTIDRTFSKQIFAEMMVIDTPLGEQPCADLLETLVNDPRFKAVGDDDLMIVVERIISENPDQFTKACENQKLIQWFVGQVMKAMQGKASAPKIIEIMNEKISQHMEKKL